MDSDKNLIKMTYKNFVVYRHYNNFFGFDYFAIYFNGEYLATAFSLTDVKNIIDKLVGKNFAKEN